MEQMAGKTPVKWLGPDSTDEQSDAYGDILPLQRRIHMIAPIMWMYV